MSQATRSRSQQFTLGPVDPSTGKRTVVASDKGTYKVQAYNLTQATTPYVSGLVSAYSGAAAARGDDEDSSDDTDDQSEEDDAAQANAEDSEGQEADGSDSGSSDELSEDIARLEVEDGEGEESDNSDSGSGDAANADEEHDEAVASAEEDDDDDDDNDQPTMPASILKTKTGPSTSTRRKSVVMIAPGFSAPETDPRYYRAQAKADKQILEKWFVSKSEAEEQADALARVKNRKKRWSAHEAASTGSGTMSSGTAQPISQPVGSETDSRTTTTIANTTSGKSGKSVDLPRRAFVKRK